MYFCIVVVVQTMAELSLTDKFICLCSRSSYIIRSKTFGFKFSVGQSFIYTWAESSSESDKLSSKNFIFFLLIFWPVSSAVRN